LSIILEIEFSYIKKNKDLNLEAYLDSSKIISIKDLKNKIYNKYNSLKSEDGINPFKLLDNTINYDELSRITELEPSNEKLHSKKTFKKIYSLNEEDNNKFDWLKIKNIFKLKWIYKKLLLIYS